MSVIKTDNYHFYVGLVTILLFVLLLFKIERLKLQRVTLETMLKIYEQNGGEVNWDDVNNI